jgi:hypothetical protein
VAPRDIERFNLDYSINEVAFRWARRLCVGFAGMAIALGVLDICGIHSIADTGQFWGKARVNVAAFGDTIRGIGERTPLSGYDGDAVTVRIPASAATSRDVASKVTSEAANEITSAIDRLADVRRRDAVEFAMAPPAIAVKPARVAAAETPAAVASATMPAQIEKPVPRAMAPVAQLGSVAVLSSSQPVSARPIQLASATVGSDPQLQSISPSPVPALLPDIRTALIPLNQVPLPQAAPPPSPAEILELTGKDYAKAHRCLANAIYFEARSEPLRGQMAVAQVVMNRVFSGFYPDNVCDVVYQNAHRRLACQFTFACDGKSKAIHDRGSWARANRIATQTLDGQIYLPEVAKSTHYHAAYVRPVWAREMKRLAKHGLHSFYRPFAWGNGAEMPVWGKAFAQADAAKKKK